MISAAALKDAALRHGLELISIISADRAAEALLADEKRLRQWQERGRAGEMRYMERSPELFTTLNNFLPSVRTIATFAISYLHEPVDVGSTPIGFARVARYAWGRDYHTVLREQLERFVAEIRSLESFEYRIFTDSVPLLERSLARAAGIGFIGKNTLLIRPGTGSFTFLAEALLTLEVEELLEVSKSEGCGGCFRCAPACPTGAIVEPRELDASRCISYLTIEKRTPFAAWEGEAIGEWLFGCDICQEVCPFNNEGVPRRGFGSFGPNEGVGPFLELRAVLQIRSDEEYRRRFAGTALLRAKRGQLIRNACAVAVNRGHDMLIPDLEEVVRDDPSELARESARTAVARLVGSPGA